MFHFEYRAYPEIALREALMNAFCHADLRLAGPILVKQFSDWIEISNPGGFIGGISPDNILHHEPVARNPRLVDALARLRLVNRSNLGVGRMFEALLIEGKEQPLIEEQGESVRVVFLKRELDRAFRAFVAEESRLGHILSLDHLLIFQYLLRHNEVDSITAARICQRQQTEAREILNTMDRERSYLERGGTGRGTYWTLHTELHRRLSVSGHPERDRRIDWEAAKTRILSIMMERTQRGEPGLSNKEVPHITRYNREQVKRLMRELSAEKAVILKGSGRGARWEKAQWPEVVPKMVANQLKTILSEKWWWNGERPIYCSIFSF
jgi:ATP-dependent DNA helicase RecG